MSRPKVEGCGPSNNFNNHYTTRLTIQTRGRQQLKLLLIMAHILWFNFILGLIFFFFCFKLIIIHCHTQKRKKIKFTPRIKLNHNTYSFRINLGFRETAHLPLPEVNIITYFPLRANCWLKGGVGGQFPRKLN